MSFDPDAEDYILQVLATGELLPPHVQAAIDRFVTGCNEDASPIGGVSNWDAMKVSYLWKGPLTFDAALVPLKSPISEIVGYTPSDYDSVLGLIGGSGKRIDVRRGNTDPSANCHSLAWVVSPPTNESTGGGSVSGYLVESTLSGARNIRHKVLSTWQIEVSCNGTGFTTQPLSTVISGPQVFGITRYSNDFYEYYAGGRLFEVAEPVQSPTASFIRAMGRGNNVGAWNTARLGFISVGESVDLSALANRVERLMRDVSSPTRRGFPLSRLVN